jgi:hypothetical protein
MNTFNNLEHRVAQWLKSLFIKGASAVDHAEHDVQQLEQQLITAKNHAYEVAVSAQKHAEDLADAADQTAVELRAAAVAAARRCEYLAKNVVATAKSQPR